VVARKTGRWGIGVVLGALVAVSHAHAHAEPATRVLTDRQGAQVAVPSAPQRIADLWFAHNELVVMLGGADRIAATVVRPRNQPWMFRLAPTLNRAVGLDNVIPNAETLLAARTDLAFYPSSAKVRTILQQAGIPAMAMQFEDFAGLRETVRLTAAALNTDDARDRATRYVASLDDRVAQIRAVTDPLPEARRPHVLHIYTLHPLRVDGRGTIIDEWIRTAGGTNAASLSGVQKPVTIEQIVAWNPDVIILGGNAGVFDPESDGGVWHGIAAVQAGRVLRNPAGVFPWDRYGSEALLQVSWAAEHLHPDLFPDDMAARIRDFYSTWFGYAVTDDDVRRILAAQPPATP